MGKKGFAKKEGQTEAEMDNHGSGYGNYLHCDLDDGQGGGNNTIQEDS
jgi:hypothetical protein